MKSYRIFLFVLASLLIFGTNTSSSTLENEKLLCSVLSVDAEGDTYFREIHIDLNSWTSGLAATSLHQESSGVGFFKAKSGWELLNLHHAPKRQYLLVLQGTIEFTTSKNITRQFSQGSILLVEDTYGKGHGTRAIGNQELILAWVPLPLHEE